MPIYPEHWTIRVWPFDNDRKVWFVQAFGRKTGCVIPMAGPRSYGSLGAARKVAREMLPNFARQGGAGLYGDDTAEIVEAAP